MPANYLTQEYLYYLLLGVFLLLIFLLAWAYTKERRSRRKAFIKFAGDAVHLKLDETEKPLYSVALLGDIGSVTDAETDPVMQLVSQWMARQGKGGSIILLGDNIYPKGLPPTDDWHYAAAEQKLQTQLKLLQQHPGHVIYLSGNHDWNKGRSDGYGYLLRQQEYVIKYLNRPYSYLPLDGCPGPVSILLCPGLRLIVINTQWWVQRGVRPIGKAFGCTVENSENFFTQLASLLEAHQNEQIIIAAHHPLYSNALHGGKFTVKQHVFPLTAAHKKFYLPLPVAGSLYPAYRRFFGAYEDMSHPRYRRMRRKLLKLFLRHQNIIYVAGHDHNLQYFPVKGNHYIVSGSGSKTAYVRKGGRAAFTHEHKGFFVVDYYANGQVWLRALEPVAAFAKDQAEIIFQRRLK